MLTSTLSCPGGITVIDVDRIGFAPELGNPSAQNPWRPAREHRARLQLRDRDEDGFGNLPICIAKTQYSFSTDPKLRGAPEGHVFAVRVVYLSAGAGFMFVSPAT